MQKQTIANAIPEKYEFRRQTWGAGTQIKQELLVRDRQIYKDYLAGSKTAELADKYYLSEKSIQRILRKISG